MVKKKIKRKKLEKLYNKEYTQKAYDELNLTISQDRVEEISSIVNSAMTSSKRIYHNPHHLWLLLQEAKGIEIFGILFHDVIYQELDDTLNELFQPIFPYVDHDGSEFTLKKENINSPHLNIVLDIFGIKDVKIFDKFHGRNEFLSALFAVEVLQGELDLPELVQVASLIESTIPFRSLSKEGNTSYDVLFNRFLHVNKKYDLKFSEGNSIEHIYRCQKISFLDVSGFYKFSLKDFISDAWKLIPEGDSSLLNKNTCSTRQIRKAMYGMYKFYCHADPYLIFQQFHESPSGKEYNLIIRKTKETLTASKRYLEVRLVEKVKRIEHFITELKARETNPDILKLLRDGLPFNPMFEYKKSLLGAHVYESIGDEKRI